MTARVAIAVEPVNPVSDWALWPTAVAIALAAHLAGLFYAGELLPGLPDLPQETEIVLDIIELSGGAETAQVTRAEVASTADRAESASAERVASSEATAAAVTAAEVDTVQQAEEETALAAATTDERVTGQALGDRPSAASAEAADEVVAETAQQSAQNNARLSGQEIGSVAEAATAERVAGQEAQAPTAIAGAEIVAGVAPNTSAAPSATSSPSTPQSSRVSAPTVAPARVIGQSAAPVPEETDPQSNQTATVVARVAPRATTPSVTTPDSAPARPSQPAALRPETVPSLTPRAEPVTPVPETAPITPDPPQIGGTGASTESPDAAQEARYQAVLEHVRGFEGGNCFAALPVLQQGALALDAFAQSDDPLESFRAGLADKVEAAPEADLKPISDAQCAVLEYLSQQPRYPDFSMRLTLNSLEISSGDVLEGRIGSAGDQWIELLLIDDEGLVQSLRPLVQATVAGGAQFAVPMTFQGEAVATKQLLLALALPEPLETISAFDGTPAISFFDKLGRETRFLRMTINAAMVGFTVTP